MKHRIMDYTDYHNHLVKLSEKVGFPTETPSIRFSVGDAFNEEVRGIEVNEGLNHEQACNIVSNSWIGEAFNETDELEDDIE